MKFALVSLAIFATVSSALAQASNSSAPSHSTVEAGASIQGLTCDQPGGAVRSWYYNSRGDGPYRCYGQDYSSFSMLNAYRSGGTEGVHWKYTDNVNDGDCLTNWNYYSEDGQTLYASIQGRTTTERDPRRWCALPVYRSGGVEWKQWASCNCYDIDSVGGV